MSTAKILAGPERVGDHYIYQVLVNGERWKASSNDEFGIDEIVEIKEQEGLELKIVKKEI